MTPRPEAVRARPGVPGGAYRVQGAGEDVVHANVFLRALELRGLSPRTVRAYAMDAVVLLRWMGAAGLDVKALTEGHLLDFIASQRAVAAAPRSINRRLTTARLLYRFLTDAEMPRGPGVSAAAPYFRGRRRDRNLGLHTLRPVQRTRLRVKVPRTLVEPLEGEAVLGFLGRCSHLRDLALVYLMLLCGLRSNEVLQLRLGDVSMRDARARVWGKGGKERALPLPPMLLQLLQDYVALERPDVGRSDKLFLVLKGRRRGQPMTPAGLRSLFRYRRREEGLEKANAHRFRHTFGTDMARAGVRLPVLQRMMGHAHAETTVQYINLAVPDVVAEYARASARIHARYAAAGLPAAAARGAAE